MAETSKTIRLGENVYKADEDLKDFRVTQNLKNSHHLQKPGNSRTISTQELPRTGGLFEVKTYVIF